MMRIADDSGVVHVATTKPGPDESGKLMAGTTACLRWWVWASMGDRYRYGRDVLEANYASTAPSCLRCIDERYPR